MTTCDPSSINEENKKIIKENNYGACTIDPTESFSEHDIDYIVS
jgi:hypothetical protein